MKLLNGDQAIVTDLKLLGYLLNPKHPQGGKRAYLFRVLLGIDLKSSEVLRRALLDAARNGEAMEGKASEYGKKFEIRFPIKGKRGSHTVLSVWILSDENPNPQLVTAYIE